MVSSRLQQPKFIITKTYYSQHMSDSLDDISYCADEVLFLFSQYHKMTAWLTCFFVYVHRADHFQSFQTQTTQVV